MLSAKKQRNAFNTAWENFTDHLWVFYHDRDPAAVHQARVAVKRLRAMVLLFQAGGDPERMPAAFRAVRKVYKRLGTVRSAQIHRARLHKFDLDQSEYSRKLHYIETYATRRFAETYHDMLPALLKAHDALEAGFADLSDSNVETLFRREKRAVERFFQKTYKRADELHAIRKRVKTLLYLHPVLPKKLRETLHLDTDRLDALQDAVGTWHDTYDTLETLRVMGYNNAPVLDDLAEQRTHLREKAYAVSFGR
jgi:CHAD domain-containing protein